MSPTNLPCVVVLFGTGSTSWRVLYLVYIHGHGNGKFSTAVATEPHDEVTLRVEPGRARVSNDTFRLWLITAVWW